MWRRGRGGLPGGDGGGGNSLRRKHPGAGRQSYLARLSLDLVTEGSAPATAWRAPTRVAGGYKARQLLSLSICAPHGFSHPLLSPLLSSLASTHTTHQIVMIRCVQCVEMKESIPMHRGSLIDVQASARANPLTISQHPLSACREPLFSLVCLCTLRTYRPT